MRGRIPFAIGHECPLCGHLTDRKPAPLHLAWLRWLIALGVPCTYRRCYRNHWRGLAITERTPPDAMGRVRSAELDRARREARKRGRR